MNAQVLEQVDPADAVQGNIQDHQVERLPVQCRERLCGIVRLPGDDQVRFVVKQLYQTFARDRMIVHDKHGTAVSGRRLGRIDHGTATSWEPDSRKCHPLFAFLRRNCDCSRGPC